MLAQGRLTATITSRATRQHVTLRFRARDDNRGWDMVTFAEANRVLISDYDLEHLGSYYPLTGVLAFTEHATEAARWAARSLLTYLAGGNPAFERQAELDAADECGRCGRELDDEESIALGFDPACFHDIAEAVLAEA